VGPIITETLMVFVCTAQLRLKILQHHKARRHNVVTVRIRSVSTGVGLAVITGEWRDG
jgi:hypothetical protein